MKRQGKPKEREKQERAFKPLNAQSAQGTAAASSVHTPLARDTVQDALVRRVAKLLDADFVFRGDALQLLAETELCGAVGIIGATGTGKSTLLSECATVNTAKQFPFVVQRDAAREHCTHQTLGADLHVSEHGVVFLDTQPVLSASVMCSMSESEVSIEHAHELECVRLIAFTMSVCSAVVILQDWIVDTQLLQLVRLAEMLVSNLNEERKHAELGEPCACTRVHATTHVC